MSNPDVKVGRKASGVENAHDNARRTVEFGCTVANYINSSEVVVAINGPKEGCPGDLLGVYGIVQGEPPPHSYTWRTTADGTTWSNPVTSSQPDFYVQLPDTPGDDIFIELVAGPLQGQMKKAFKTVYAKTDVSDCKLIATSTSAPRDPDLIVYPNPSTGVITVDSEFLKLIERITVVDLSGRVLIDKEINTNENRITLNLIHLEPGLYMVSAFTYELAIVKPIILHR